MTAQFRIGGVYGDSSGRHYRLYDVRQAPSGQCKHENAAWAKGITKSGNEYPQGFRSLIDGRDLATYAHDGGDRNLLVGELDLINGHWEPILPWRLAAKERVEQKRAAENTTERVRPPLTWATPKPVDRWEGFTVRYDTGAQLADDNNHPLQRMTDPSDPAHGSAFLRKG